MERSEGSSGVKHVVSACLLCLSLLVPLLSPLTLSGGCPVVSPSPLESNVAFSGRKESHKSAMLFPL